MLQENWFYVKTLPLFQVKMTEFTTENVLKWFDL